jgi:hypothetical protein
VVIETLAAEGASNTGALITAIGGVLTVVIGTLLAFFIRRTDRVSKMTAANMQDQQYVLRLVSVLRDDYWGAADWMYFARSAYSSLRAWAAEHGHFVELLPVIPTPLHRELEAKHARGEALDDDDGK